MIFEIDASVYIKHAWREVDGKRQLIDLNYDENGFPDGDDVHKKALEETIINGGCAIAVFDNQEKCVGFITLNKGIFGHRWKYVLLDQLFISRNYRNQGIGRALFELVVLQAKKWFADKVYVCAGSSEDTIAFYKALGFVEAKEIDPSLLEDDPRDIHLEYQL